MNFFRSLARFIVFRNVWIALCAVSMLEETRWFFGEPANADTLAIFIFFATFFEYNLHSFGGKFNLLEPLVIFRYLIGTDIKPVLRVCVIVGFAGSLVYFFLLASPGATGYPLMLRSDSLFLILNIVRLFTAEIFRTVVQVRSLVDCTRHPAHAPLP